MVLQLPTELSIYIFSYCDAETLTQIPRVCASWKVISSTFSHDLWGKVTYEKIQTLSQEHFKLLNRILELRIHDTILNCSEYQGIIACGKHPGFQGVFCLIRNYKEQKSVNPLIRMSEPQLTL